MTRRPPHIVVTTPESLYLLLTSTKGRELLRTVQTVIVDEIHALARDKRGSHLALSLERLDHLCRQRDEGRGRPPVRIGLSATQRPMDEIGRFLIGAGHLGAGHLNESFHPPLRPEIATPTAADDEPAPSAVGPLQLVDVGHVRQLDLGIEIPEQELSAVCSVECWSEVYNRLAELIRTHRSTLVFVNTRRLAERVAHNLTELLGEDAVASHHGSLSKELRLSAERRLQSGELRAIVATNSLELGIDVGYIDLVCQVSTPRSIAAFLQRIGRAGHSLRAIPKGRLFPLTRDDLLECMALVRAVRARRLDRIEIPEAPLDILAQQIVAAVAADDWEEQALFELCRSAWPYRDLQRAQFDEIVQMLSEGIGRGQRRGAWLHRDRIGGQLRARRGARIAALTSGGAIPDNADYRVVTQGERTLVGAVNEDFAIESMAGDIFLLGNSSWRVVHVRGGEVVVNDAEGAPASIPFWLGEGPGRTPELSQEVSELREEIAAGLDEPAPLIGRLVEQCAAPERAVEQMVNYIATQQAAIGVIPSIRQIVFERFFDESGGMQLVIHSPWGARINRAWGLAMRKRFCRSFDFELQAAADDNGIVLSLGPQHSFPIEQLFPMLNVRNARGLLEQALLAAPMFQLRWRWNASRALAILRMQSGKKVPPHLLRMRSDDLLAAVFPTATACLENIVGDIEIPDQPLIRQTVYDCLHEAMDFDRWLDILRQVEQGEIEFVPRDTREPSPFSYELLNANRYAFLDDAPLEERRTRAVATRRTFTPQDVGDLARLDPEAIEQVRREAWPAVRDAEELHDALLTMIALFEDEAIAPADGRQALHPPCAEFSNSELPGVDRWPQLDWGRWLQDLASAGRAAAIETAGGRRCWFAAERWNVVQALFPEASPQPALNLPEELCAPVESTAALQMLLRGRLEVSGPVALVELARQFGLRESAVTAALEALEGDGAVLRGHFTVAARPDVPREWCDRRLLARIHRLTLDAARKQVQPVDVATFWRFLCEHQHATPDSRWQGTSGVRAAIAQLQGCQLPGGAWEAEVLPTRVVDYDPRWLDSLCLEGQVAWGRLLPPKKREDAAPSGSGVTRVVPLALTMRSDLGWLLPRERADLAPLARPVAQDVLAALRELGATFYDDLLSHTALLPAQLDDVLSELAALGLIASDSFAAIRPLVAPERPLTSNKRRSSRRGAAGSYARGGRWSRFPAIPAKALAEQSAQRSERWAQLLLDRYGVVFRDLLLAEDAAPAWWEMLPALRRLEARGNVRGGRFVAGVAGEQYALPQAVERLRKLRDTPPDAGEPWIILAATDPLNLTGILPGVGIRPGETANGSATHSASVNGATTTITTDSASAPTTTGTARLPAVSGNRLAVRQGRVIAVLQAGETTIFESLSPEERANLERGLQANAAARLRRREAPQPKASLATPSRPTATKESAPSPRLRERPSPRTTPAAEQAAISSIAQRYAMLGQRAAARPSLAPAREPGAVTSDGTADSTSS